MPIRVPVELPNLISIVVGFSTSDATFAVNLVAPLPKFTFLNVNESPFSIYPIPSPLPVPIISIVEEL